jgi:hypothetical protein
MPRSETLPRLEKEFPSVDLDSGSYFERLGPSRG